MVCSSRALQFVEFLHGNENSVFNPEHDTVYQDMNQPFAHYFCNSSHNTYLMGSQITGESSVEAYVRTLLFGCRCVEIDCWNKKDAKDPEDRIDVTHGNTMTTKINFKDVLQSIMEHAFTTSSYPLVLSIENHCNVENQKTMAKLFKEKFCNYLLTEPLSSCPEPRNAYPSPAQMGERIIIKYKKLKDGVIEGQVENNASRSEQDIADSLKTGTLLMEDKVDGSWTPHFFMLTQNKISYGEQPVVDGSDELESKDEATVVDPEDNETQKELHRSEAWFHGRLDGGRTAAEQLLQLHLPDLDASRREGFFLVRESDTFPGEFSLSFWRETGVQQVRHCRIRCKDSKYFLTDLIAFVNLYELIEYYKREPLKSKDFELKLRDAVPQPAPHESKKWFYKKCSREQAEDMLRRIRSDGAFLVRESETGKGFAISFRSEGKIKHCRVKREARMYCMGDTEFDSLVKLVEYYEKVALYRKMKLKYAVDQELLDRHGEEPEEDIYNSSMLYQTPNSVTTQADTNAQTGVSCRALYAYRATQGEELSFPAHATITNVQQKDGGWWRGDYGGHLQGWLPSNYVEEIDNTALAAQDDSENPLGNLEKQSLDVDGLHVEPRPSTTSQRLIFRIVNSNSGKYFDVGAADETEMKDWAKVINDAAKTWKEHGENRTKLEARMKIAQELSDMIFYVQSTHFKDFETSKGCLYQVMSSFGEKKAMNFVTAGGQPAQFSEYCRRQIARVYPKGSRVSSTNYDPQPCWNCGLQMIALNFQTPDKAMWQNHGKFRQNGGCGYILKPKVLTEDTPKDCEPFNPHEAETYQNRVQVCKLNIKIVSGRHIVKPKRGVLSPFVEVEIIGVPNDANKYKTRTIPDNGFNPVWNESVDFNINLPELACLAVTVLDEDMFGDTTPVAQNVIPVTSLRQGWRSVQLKSIHNYDLELAAILLHVEIEYPEASQRDEYKSLALLKEELIKTRSAQQYQVKQTIGQQLAGKDMTQQKQMLGQLNEKVFALEQKLGEKETKRRGEYYDPTGDYYAPTAPPRDLENSN